jgi:hypothetical protein
VDSIGGRVERLCPSASDVVCRYVTVHVNGCHVVIRAKLHGSGKKTRAGKLPVGYWSQKRRPSNRDTVECPHVMTPLSASGWGRLSSELVKAERMLH